MYEVKTILKESMPVLTICALIGIFSGLILNRNEQLLKFLPSILIILPSFIGMAGNISSVLSSRLSSALHLGLLAADIKRSEVLSRNIYATLIISLISFLFLGLIAGLISFLFGLKGFSIFIFPLITLVAGLLTVIILALFSVSFSYISFRKGLDPDDIVIPLLTTIGDLIAIFLLFFIASFLLS